MSVTKVSSAMQDLTDDYAFTGTISGAGAPSHRNDIINGGLVVNQENVTAPADDDYTIGDLFLHVGEGTPTMSLETDGPQGTRPWQKMVLDANDQGGLVYFMSNDDVQDYIANGKLSFGIQLKTTSATIANARIGILKWVGTADSVTSDVVGTWASDGTNPTLATSWSYENTPANIGLTTSWARHTVEDITVDSNTTNIAIFVWTDDGTITASDVIGFSEWQCNPGSTVHAFSQPDKSTVMRQVNHYLYREEYNTVGGFRQASAYTTNFLLATVEFNGEMHRIPTATRFDAAALTYYGNNGSAVASAITFQVITQRACEINLTATATLGHAGIIRFTGAGDYVQFDARL